MDLRRGTLVTAAPSGQFTKPRPMVIVQADEFAALETVTVLMITSDLARLQGLRIPVMPTSENGLRLPSEIMTDLLMTVPLQKIGRVIGQLDDVSMAQIDQALRAHLGLP